ncbi:Multidrug resistance efflux pump PmrA [Streptococcus sp. DD10]|nr:Multidrug resistance efflux pump PmrA [Streptococcus sp. DD10]
MAVFIFAAILTILFIKEDFHPVAKEKEVKVGQLFSLIRYPHLLFNLFLTSFVIQFSAQSIGPILALYIRDLGQKDNLMVVAGLIVSAMGLSSMLSSSILGRLGDRVGNHRLLLWAQLFSVVIYLLCANARSPLELGVYRFLFGLGTGALIPGVTALLSKITPKVGISRVFSWNQVFFYLGGVVGPMAGSFVAGLSGYHAVFYATASLVSLSLVFNLIQFKKLLKVKEF